MLSCFIFAFSVDVGWGNNTSLIPGGSLSFDSVLVKIFVMRLEE